MIILGSLKGQTSDCNIIFTKIHSIFYNQIGLIFIEHDTTFVYYADQVVFKMTLHEYLKNFKHSIRKIDDEIIMTNDVKDKMKSFVKTRENKSYDNAKFVWDAYRSTTGIPLCKKSDISVRKISQCYFLE
jgi:hypothetical protein